LASIQGGVCGDADATDFSALTTAICLCPSSTAIQPCACALSTGSNSTVTITCADAGLGDSKIAEILVKVSAKTPLDTLVLSGNKLTKVASTSRRSGSGIEDEDMIRATAITSLLTQFTQLNYVDLSSNVIITIGAGELALTAPVNFLSLANNTITSIEADALPSTILIINLQNSRILQLLFDAATYVNGSQIVLDSNRLTNLQPAVFNPILTGFKNSGFTKSFISVAQSN